jgi:hypothetical protein
MKTKASLLFLALPLTACSGDDGRSYTQLALEVEGLAPTAANHYGYTVTLTRAEADLGPVRFFEGEPLFSQLRREALGLIISTAYAHPGHYQEGSAVAELLDPHVVDLLGGVVSLGTADGVTGDYNSAELTFGPSAALDGAAIRLSGTAEKDGVQRPFTATLTDAVKIEGIAFGAPVDAVTGKIRITVDLASWLDRVDFSTLGPDGVFTPGEQPHNALSRGVDNTSSIHFSIVE